MAGFGVWALVGAYFVSGVFIAVGAFWMRPFRPSWQFRFSAIRPLVTFGIRSASSNVLEQIFKNIDFLLVGWFYGAAALAIYRVAFDIAMEPAMAVGLLVNRTALPVFSRLATNLALMREALLWALQRLAVLVAPCMAGLALMAVPLLDLLHDAQGRSYAAAALPLQILAVAALLRAASQLIIPVLMGSGRPGTAAKLALATLLLLSGLIMLAGCTAHGPRGSVAVAVAWLAAYPPLLAWDAHYLWRKLEISPLALLRPFLPPGIAIAGMISLVCLFRLFGWVEAPLPRIALAVAATGCAYGGLMCWSRSGKAAATSAL
jgi:O-antigen/teichoic acid export membrane protein